MAESEARRFVWLDRLLMCAGLSVVLAVLFGLPGRLQESVDLRLAFGRFGIATEEAAALLMLLPVAALALVFTGAWRRFQDAGPFRWLIAVGTVVWLVMDRNGVLAPPMPTPTLRAWIQFAGLVMVFVACASALAAGSRTPRGARP